MNISLGSAISRGARREAGRGGADRLLLVRHGPNRGPRRRLEAWRPKVYQPLLDDFAARYPDLRQAIDVWETGSGPAPDLSRASAIVFILSDPLRELYPACYREAEALAQQAVRLGIRLVNSPAALSNTIKSRQAELLRSAGVNSPRHLPFASLEEFRRRAREISYPAIVRADLLHAQQRMAFCRSRAEALALPDNRIALPGSIAEFIDTRESFRASQPDSLFARHFHKKRAFVFGRHVVNNHIFFGPEPIVGGLTSTFGHYRSLNPVRRMIGNARCRPHLEADYAYFRSAPADAPVLIKAAEALDLEFAAVDYSSRADGSIVIWEFNPHFSLYPWPFEVLPKQRHLRERHLRFHDTIQLFFRELLEAAS